MEWYCLICWDSGPSPLGRWIFLVFDPDLWNTHFWWKTNFYWSVLAVSPSYSAKLFWKQCTCVLRLPSDSSYIQWKDESFPSLPLLTIKKWYFHFIPHFFYLSTMNLSFQKDSWADSSWGLRIYLSLEYVGSQSNGRATFLHALLDPNETGPFLRTRSEAHFPQPVQSPPSLLKM